MKFGINQAISQTITQLSCIQLETPSSRLWNFWWIKTYTTIDAETRWTPFRRWHFHVYFLQWKYCIWIKFSLKYVRKGPIDNDPALVQIRAWRGSGDKPLSEPIIVNLLTHICVTRRQWVKMPWQRSWYIIFWLCICSWSLRLVKNAWNNLRFCPFEANI